MDRCKNFLKLCTINYYDSCLFHTIQKDFTAQTGDPTGTGTAGDSVYNETRFFTDEIHLDLKHTKTGTVAMASAGENLNASQFYFTLRDNLNYLDGKHTVFGEVAEGLETLERINEAYVDEKGRPYKNIRLMMMFGLKMTGFVVSADIIRDYKIGDSLCYAFIEFEDKDACEHAYFNVWRSL